MTLSRLIALVAMGASLIGASPPPAAPVLAEFTLGVIGTNATNWPIYIAERQGFFAKEGLHVNYIAVTSPPNAVNLAASKGADLTSEGTDSAIAAIANGVPIKIILPGMITNPYSLVAVAPISKVSELKNKTIMLGTKQDLSAIAFQDMIRPYHLDMERDFSILIGGTTNIRYAALMSGNVQATFLAQPQDFVAENDGMRIIARASDIERQWQFLSYIANSDLASSRRPQIIAYARAMRDAIDFATTHRQAAIDVLVQATRLDGAVAAKTYDLYFSKWHAFDKDERLNPRLFKGVEDAMVRIGVLPAAPPVTELYDDSFVKAAFDR